MGQYGYNAEMAPTRLDLQNMPQKAGETFREYASRWRDHASHVDPPLTEKEMTSTFISTLKQPFYSHLIAQKSSTFSHVVHIGDGVQEGIRTGKIMDYSIPSSGTLPQAECSLPRQINVRKTEQKAKENEVEAVTRDPQIQYAQSSRPVYLPQQPIPQSNPVTP